MASKTSQVAIVMGSDSDLPTMQSCIDQLKKFDIDPIVRVISAHRTPDIAADFASNAEKNGTKIIIAAAGMAAHISVEIALRRSGWSKISQPIAPSRSVRTRPPMAAQTSSASRSVSPVRGR